MALATAVDQIATSIISNMTNFFVFPFYFSSHISEWNWPTSYQRGQQIYKAKMQTPKIMAILAHQFKIIWIKHALNAPWTFAWLYTEMRNRKRKRSVLSIALYLFLAFLFDYLLLVMFLCGMIYSRESISIKPCIFKP